MHLMRHGFYKTTITASNNTTNQRSPMNTIRHVYAEIFHCLTVIFLFLVVGPVYCLMSLLIEHMVPALRGCINKILLLCKRVYVGTVFVVAECLRGVHINVTSRLYVVQLPCTPQVVDSARRCGYCMATLSTLIGIFICLVIVIFL
jgi:hypothetical protein